MVRFERATPTPWLKTCIFFISNVVLPLLRSLRVWALSFLLPKLPMVMSVWLSSSMGACSICVASRAVKAGRSTAEMLTSLSSPTLSPM